MTPLASQPLPQLSRRRGLPGTLKSKQQHDPGRWGILAKSALRVTEQRQHLIADDLDDLLTRRKALQYRLVHRLVPDPVDECLDDLEVDVGFEQSKPDLAQGGFDMLWRQPDLAAQRLEDVLDARAQRLEHVTPREDRRGLTSLAGLSPTDANAYLRAGQAGGARRGGRSGPLSVSPGHRRV